MSDFEKWFRSLNANGKTVYFLGNEHKVSEMAWNHQQAIIDEHTEVIKLQDADLRKYEKQIESLKAQLNNMEACYIGVKKERDELQGRIDEISGYATELAEYASYSEIIGAISHNREAVRVYCDKIFAYNRAIDIEEEKALRGES